MSTTRTSEQDCPHRRHPRTRVADIKRVTVLITFYLSELLIGPQPRSHSEVANNMATFLWEASIWYYPIVGPGIALPKLFFEIAGLCIKLSSLKNGLFADG